MTVAITIAPGLQGQGGEGLDNQGMNTSQGGYTVVDLPQQTPDSLPYTVVDLASAPAGATSELGRQAGLTARYGIEGLAGLPTMVGDAANTAINYGIQGVNKAAGTDIPQFDMPSVALAQGLTKAGLPEPQNSQERIIGDAAKAVASVGGAAKLGTLLAEHASPLVASTARALKSNIGTQTGGAITGATTAGLAREAGQPWYLQMLAGLLGGVGGGSVAAGTGNVAKRVVRGTVAATRPFTEGGRQQIVGQLLNNAVKNKSTAIENLKTAPEYIPGSQPTTGEASGDYGLIALERGLKGASPADFADRYSQQNVARNAALDAQAGNENSIKMAEAAREKKTAPMREKAFAQARQGVNPGFDEAAQNIDLSPVNTKITDILSAPEGKGETVKKALEWAMSRVNSVNDAPSLYEIRKDLGYAMDGKLSGERADFKLARKQLIQVKQALDETIENEAPGFKKYLDTYSKMSKPIEQMELLQEGKQRATLSAPDPVTGKDFISQAKWSQWVDNNKKELAKKLTPIQHAVVQMITKDLDRGSATNNPAIKPAGSDTFQNASTAHVIGQAIGGNKSLSPFAKTVFQPLEWLYKMPEKDIQKLLVKAMLEPKIAAKLLQKVTVNSMESLSVALKKYVTGAMQGSTVGTATSMNDKEKKNAIQR